MLPFELTKDTPYLALSGELWSVFYEYFNRNWPCYKGFLLYQTSEQLSRQPDVKVVLDWISSGIWLSFDLLHQGFHLVCVFPISTLKVTGSVEVYLYNRDKHAHEYSNNSTICQMAYKQVFTAISWKRFFHFEPLKSVIDKLASFFNFFFKYIYTGYNQSV